MNIKTTLKASVAVAALFAIAAPVATTANAADDTFKTGNKNSLTMSGYVTRALWYADDGPHEGLFNTDGGTGSTRVRWIASGQLNENISMGAMIESNLPLTNQENGGTGFGGAGTSGDEVTTDTAAWSIRHQFVWVSHKTLGKISLGQTNAASNGGVQANLANHGSAQGTMDNVWVGQNLEFMDTSASATSSGSFTGVQLTNTIQDLDFTSRTDVIRYDTPTFGGAKLAVSLSQAGGGEVGGTYGGKFGSVKVVARAGYSENSSAGANDHTVGGSIALLHDSGINVQFSAAARPRKATGAATGRNIFGSLGYNAKIFGAGGTGFLFSWNRSTHVSARGSVATGWGITANQNFDAIGAKMQLVYRNYEYNNNRLSHRTIDDIDVFGLNTVFNF